MAWLVLLVAAVLEAVWATALHASEGFSRPVPATSSLAGLGWAMRSIPTGTAYAVWTGVGAVLTVAWAMGTGTEVASPLKVAFLAGIIACVAGLKLLDAGPDAAASPPAT